MSSPSTLTPAELRDILSRRVLILDGAMGTMIQRLGLSESQWRGGRFADWQSRLSGNNDLLSLTRKADIHNIHRRYIEAGADIITANSFNSNRLSMARYGMEGLSFEIARESARLARRAADEAPAGRRVLVAGTIGPTAHAASLSPDVEDAAKRDVDFDTLADAFREQALALADGGADIILIETVYDNINLRAALLGCREAMAPLGIQLPVMVSATVADRSGRILSGQTIPALALTAECYPEVVGLGLNCSSGPADTAAHIRRLADVSHLYISCHPNAGLPDELGRYAASPEIFAAEMEPLLTEGILNIAGGCCGTTPQHIEALAALRDRATPHRPKPSDHSLSLAGLEPLRAPEGAFTIVGERCNVAGSRKFLRLIKEENFDEALQIAASQVKKGAQVIDINLDDPLLDTRPAFTRLLRLAGADPDIARVPFMIDTSDPETAITALKNLQGKAIVNSISLRDGEEELLRRARLISSLGAAMVVMAFDEQGQADTFSRKTEICARAYRLLTGKGGIAPRDIIFDPNIMAVATGMEAHDLYARDFIEATRWIKRNLPGAKVSGGVSNLSFAFRGNNPLREAMHAVFLHHARLAGMDMAIVNPAALPEYEDIEPELRALLDDVVLARRKEAPAELSEYALTHLPEKKGAAANASKATAPQRDSLSPQERLRDDIVVGDTTHLEKDLDELLGLGDDPRAIIDGPLMEGMEEVGRRFADGRMFLPQVVKTARAMKRAVDHLRPLMLRNDGARTKAGHIVIATVKGDVHDIGKNIVASVLECNNFKVTDLGVMAPAEKIVETAKREKADIVCLSGLITPSLGEMAEVALLMEKERLRIPLMVGGAATSRLHTALKIAPLVSFPVVHATDASQNPLIAARLLDPATGREYAESLRQEYDRVRREHEGEETPYISLEEARKRRLSIDWSDWSPVMPETGLANPQTVEIAASDLLPLINWKMLLHAWRLTGGWLATFPYEGDEKEAERWLATIEPSQRDKARQARQLYREARTLLEECGSETVARGVTAFYESNSDGDDLVIGEKRLPMLRNQKPDDGAPALSLADFVMPATEGRPDILGVFAVSAAIPESRSERYDPLVAQTLSDRLAEAAAEWLHRNSYPGIRPAVGYPSLPDQLLNLKIADLLPIADIGIEMTENGAMAPSSSVCGLYIARPESRYFMIKGVAADQLADYARRRGIDRERIKKALGRYIIGH